MRLTTSFLVLVVCLFLVLLVLLISVVDGGSSSSSSSTWSPSAGRAASLSLSVTGTPSTSRRGVISGYRGGGGRRQGVGSRLPRFQRKELEPQKNGDGPLRIFARTIMDSRRHLAAAAAARSTSIFAMYPVDTIKVS